MPVPVKFGTFLRSSVILFAERQTERSHNLNDHITCALLVEVIKTRFISHNRQRMVACATPNWLTVVFEHSLNICILYVPRFQIDTYGRRTFAVAGPTTWNLFHNNLRKPDMQIDCFRRTLKTFLYQYSAH